MENCARKSTHHRAALAAALVLACSAFARAEDYPAAAAPALPAASPASAAPVTVRVNGVAITEDAIDTMVERLDARTKPGSRTGASGELLRKEALRRVIFQELIYQRARATGVNVSDADIEAAAAQFKTGHDRGAVDLQESGLRALVERNLVMERFLAQEVTSRITVTEAELKSLYERRRPGFRTPERIGVTDVLFFLDPEAAPSRAQAQAVLGQLRADPAHDAGTLAPDSSFLVQRRDLKPAAEPRLAEAARRLAPGDLSGLVNADGNLHILRLDVYEPERDPPFAELQPRLERELRGAAERTRLLELEAELRNAARIEIVGGPGGAPAAPGEGK
jgi:parvulin-like peptidyl-prolyl isomerase